MTKVVLLSDIRKMSLFLGMLVLGVLLIACTSRPTGKEDLIKCSDRMVFCQDSAEWVCPDKDYFGFCRDISRISPEVCEKEDVYVQWLLKNCPNVGILE